MLGEAGPLSFPGSGRSKRDTGSSLERPGSNALSGINSEPRQFKPATPGVRFEDEVEEKGNVQSRVAENARNVRLNFLEASWKTVLNTYAEQVGATLVADPKMIPTNRFTRPDRSFYTASEALKILNRELQTYDLKLVGKSDHLVLMDLPSTRANYVRPTLHGTGLVPNIPFVAKRIESSGTVATAILMMARFSKSPPQMRAKCRSPRHLGRPLPKELNTRPIQTRHS